MSGLRQCENKNSNKICETEYIGSSQDTFNNQSNNQ